LRIDPIIHASQVSHQGSSSGGLIQLFMLVRVQGSSGRWRIYPIIHASQGRVQGSSGGGLMQAFMLVRSVAKGSSGSGLIQSFMLVRQGPRLVKWRIDPIIHASQVGQSPRLVRLRIDAIIHASQGSHQSLSSGGLMQSFMPVRSVTKARQVED